MPQSDTSRGLSRTGVPPLIARAAEFAMGARDNGTDGVAASGSAGIDAADAAAAIDARNSLRLTMPTSVERRVFQPYSIHRAHRNSSLVTTKLRAPISGREPVSNQRYANP